MAGRKQDRMTIGRQFLDAYGWRPGITAAPSRRVDCDSTFDGGEPQHPHVIPPGSRLMATISLTRTQAIPCPENYRVNRADFMAVEAVEIRPGDVGDAFVGTHPQIPVGIIDQAPHGIVEEPFPRGIAGDLGSSVRAAVQPVEAEFRADKEVARTSRRFHDAKNQPHSGSQKICDPPVRFTATQPPIGRDPEGTFLVNVQSANHVAGQAFRCAQPGHDLFTP